MLRLRRLRRRPPSCFSSDTTCAAFFETGVAPDDAFFPVPASDDELPPIFLLHLLKIIAPYFYIKLSLIVSYKKIAMYVYRLHKYVNSSAIPSLPLFSVEDAIPFTRIPTVSMDKIEIVWNHDNYLSIVLEFPSINIYFIVTEKSIPDTELYYPLCLEVHDVVPYDYYDSYAKPILRRFVERLQRRLDTRILLRVITASISYAPTEIEYHVRLLHELDREGNSDLYDRPFLQRIKDESRAAIKAMQ
jgi:hypothetical protein